MSVAVGAAVVGTVLPPLTPDPISRTTLALYAGASGDHNPMHIDLDAARAGGYPDVFAHGMLSMAYLARAVTGWFGQGALREYTVRFVSITPVHALPTCRGTVVGVEDGRATVELTVTLPDGTVTLRGTAVVDSEGGPG